jgi:hypothetical protein
MPLLPSGTLLPSSTLLPSGLLTQDPDARRPVPILEVT